MLNTKKRYIEAALLKAVFVDDFFRRVGILGRVPSRRVGSSAPDEGAEDCRPDRWHQHARHPQIPIAVLRAMLRRSCHVRAQRVSGSRCAARHHVADVT